MNVGVVCGIKRAFHRAMISSGNGQCIKYVGFWSVLLMVALSVFAGCGDAPSSGRTTIAVIPMGTTHEFWKSIHAGAKTAADEYGVDIIWKGPLKEDDRDEQIQIAETFIAAGVDAIMISPLDDRALIRPVREALANGIPTVLVNSMLQESYHKAAVTTNNHDGGAHAAHRLAMLLGGTGTVIVVPVSESDVTTNDRVAGFMETIRAEYPGIEILSSNQQGGVTTETAYRTCENLLNRFPDVDALFTPNESTTFGSLRALQDRGLAGEIVFIGFDSSEKLVQALERSELHGLVLQDPFKMGYEGVRITVAMLTGNPFEKRIDTGTIVATPENMNDPAVQKLLNPNLSILGNK